MREVRLRMVAEIDSRYGPRAADIAREMAAKAEREAAREVGLDAGDERLH